MRRIRRRIRSLWRITEFGPPAIWPSVRAVQPSRPDRSLVSPKYPFPPKPSVRHFVNSRTVRREATLAEHSAEIARRCRPDRRGEHLERRAARAGKFRAIPECPKPTQQVRRSMVRASDPSDGAGWPGADDDYRVKLEPVVLRYRALGQCGQYSLGLFSMVRPFGGSEFRTRRCTKRQFGSFGMRSHFGGRESDAKRGLERTVESASERWL
jgi:hypothetical protein